ncbi:MAG: DUF885 family protein, partial [Candidatus Thorarchaeota archaeon]
MNDTINDLITKFLRVWATFNPYNAFGEGWREFGGLINIDSPDRLDNYHYFLKSFKNQLTKFEYNSLSEKEKIEYLLTENKIDAELFNLIDLDSYHTNPLQYVGSAFIFEYLLKKYAPLQQRIEELALHLAHLPLYYQQAIKNLDKDKLAPELIEMAHLMTSGMISFLSNLENEIKDLESESGEKISQSVITETLKNNILAIKALEEYDTYLKTALPLAKTSFRLGKEKYLKMLESTERVTNITLEKLLSVCEANLQRNKKEFEEAAKRIDPNKTPDEIIKKVKKNHPSKEKLIIDTQNILNTAKEFCRNLVNVPSEVMPKVIVTPKPYRAFAFAAMNSPGALETVATDSYYYITPPDDDWPEEQQKEWLEVFNY